MRSNCAPLLYTLRVSTAFLIESIVALVLCVNAVRPLSAGGALSFASMMLSWLCMELAPQSLVIQFGFTLGFSLSGGLDGTAGKIALVLSLVSMALLAYLISVAMRSKRVVEDALTGTLGTDYGERTARRHPDDDLRVPWRQLVLPFWMRHPDVERIRNLAYGDPHRRNMLDVYRHRDRPTGCPTLIEIHGGGWTIGNKDQQGKPIMLHLASRGWVCFAPNYRLAPRALWPAQIVDVKRAVAWVREHAEEYGGDPDFIVVSGGSAGGHLAALAALTANDPAWQPGFEGADTSVQAVIPYYGVYDFTRSETRANRALMRLLQRQVFRKKLSDEPGEFAAASPVHRVNADAPPFFVIHGAHDSLVPVTETRRFVERLRAESKAPVVYAELPGAQHAFDVFPSIRTAHVTRASERFADHVYSLYRERADTVLPQAESS
jgi:acetyl esterase/lipase